MGHGLGLIDRKDYLEIEPLIKEAEREVEENYLRYCDVVDPLHFLTMGMARAAINAMRIRVRLPKVRAGTATRAELSEILSLSLKILDTDAAAYTNGAAKKYLWHAQAFFAWGSWDSLIFILTTLRRGDAFDAAETDAAWKRVVQAYENHGEFLGFKRSLPNVAMARLVLKAWDASPPSQREPEPGFVAALRSMPKAGVKKRGPEKVESVSSSGPTVESSTSDPSPPEDLNILAGDFGLEGGNDFDIDSNDWVFWDKLIHDFQSQSS